MNFNSEKILTGISLLGTDEGELTSENNLVPDVIEINPQEEYTSLLSNWLTHSGPKITIAAGFWYFMGEEESEKHERFNLLQEYCQTASALACVIKLPPSHLLNTETSSQVLRFQEKWKSKASCPLYFEPGREGPPTWADPTFCVSDPLWNPSHIQSDYWKIHGWHPERWVRLYPKSELILLARQAERLQPKFLILGHSQRRTQFTILKSAFKRGSK